MSITVIGDIHGEADLLRDLLTRIDSSDALIFVGDLIDRGHDNRGVIETVRPLVESGRAICLMGNHELNAVLFHTLDADGVPLRERTEKRVTRHEAFLRDYPVGDLATHNVIEWFASLPVFIDRPDLRVVHAQWDAAAIDRVRQAGDERGGLPSNWTDRWQFDLTFRNALFTLLNGTEHTLPDGQTVLDKSGQDRAYVRLSWWNGRIGSRFSDQIAGPTAQRMQFFDQPPTHMPDALYPADAPPVVFGHYGFDDDQALRAPNVICVDHTRRAGGPLTAWRTDGTFMQVR